MPSAAEWMARALALASQAEMVGEVPVGALVVKNDQVVGQGYNQPIRCSDPSAHAEIVALRSAAKALDNYRLIGCDLYVTLEPCLMCLGAIFHARINKVYFGATDPKAGVLASQLQLADHTALNHHLSWEGGILAEPCGAILSQFFKKRRK